MKGMVLMTKPSVLLIAEKDSQVQDFRQVYFKHRNEIPYTFYFGYLAGHVDELKPENNEKWSFENALNIPQGFLKWNFDGCTSPQDSPFQIKASAKKKQQSILNTLETHPIDYICVATDPDIEGSYLAAAFLSTLPLKYQKLPRLRLFANDNTEQTLLPEFKHLHKNDDELPEGKKTYHSLENSGVLRGQVNFIMGTSLTRALTLKNNNLIKVGYVKAPILQLVNKRYEQYVNFKPQNYYEIEAKASHANGNFNVKLVDAKKNQTIKFKDKDIANKNLNLLPAQGKILKQEKKKVITQAPKFYKLTELQGVLNKRYNISFDKSMTIIEKLYNKDKILSYPRTDSTVLADGQIKDLPAMVTMCMSIPALRPFAERAIKLNRFDEVAKNKRFVNQKKVDTHPALTLNPHEKKSFDWNSFTKTEQQVIYEVGLSCLLPFLEPKETARTKVLISIEGHEKINWMATGSVVLKAGWSELIHSKPADDELKDSLPSMYVNDDIALNPTLSEHETKPQPLYTESSLIKHLGTLSNLDDVLPKKYTKLLKDFAQGIGTSATRGSIITELIKNGTLMITNSKSKLPAKRVIPTQEGVKLAKQLSDMQIMQIEDVVQFEMDLTAVQKREMKPEVFQDKYIELAKQQIARVKDSNTDQINLQKESKRKSNESLGACPICGSDVIETTNSFRCKANRYKKTEDGKWNHEGCSFQIYKQPFNMKTKLTKTDIKSLLKGNQTKKKKFISKKTNKEYSAALQLEQPSNKLKLIF